MRKVRCMCMDENTCINEIGYMYSHTSLPTLTLMLPKTCISVHTEVGGHLRDQVKYLFTPSDLCTDKRQAGLQFKILHTRTRACTSRHLHWLCTHTCNPVCQGLANSALKVTSAPAWLCQSHPVIYSLWLLFGHHSTVE